jgi:hypothetical protein
MDPIEYKRSSIAGKFAPRGYDPVPLTEQNTSYKPRQFQDGQEHLLSETAPMAGTDSHSRSISRDRSMSPPNTRAPRLPSVDLAPQTGYAPQGWQPQGGHQGSHAY